MQKFKLFLLRGQNNFRRYESFILNQKFEN